jgi:hypothetical protein
MANLGTKQSYINRDFESIRGELVDLLKVYYPEQWQDFNVTSVGMSLVDLLAYVSDTLSYNTDKRFNELFLDGVTEREAVFRLAKTLGYKPTGNRPAITLIDITISVPPTATGPNVSYLPVFRQGLQVRGNGQVFETVSDCDFSSDFSENGVANRIITPIFNANQDILRYNVTKREIVKAGTTVIYQRDISSDDASTPFLELTLPETNVLDILSVINKPSQGYTQLPTFQEFSDPTMKYYEVEYLAQDKVFVEDTAVPPVNGIMSGYYMDVPQRFMKEFMSNGRCKLTFGGGINNYVAYQNYLSNITIYDDGLIDVADVLNNDALGTKLLPTSTVYVKYRIGGGSLSNVGVGTLTQVSNIQSNFQGTDINIIQNIIGTTQVNNPLPAIGGADLQSVDEIKFYASSNYASQDRCVTLQDYIARVNQMPGKFGSPFRTWGQLEDNKVKLYILSKDANGKLVSNSNSVVKNNIASYLVPFRMLNDYIEINDGQVINLQCEIDLFVDKSFNSNEIKLNAINAVKAFFDINRWTFNQNIYVSQIVDSLREIAGVINVVDVRFYNMEGGNYSNVILSQAVGDRLPIVGTSVYRTQIEYIDNTIFSTSLSMWEIKFPDKDIMVRVA